MFCPRGKHSRLSKVMLKIKTDKTHFLTIGDDKLSAFNSPAKVKELRRNGIQCTGTYWFF
jgi:hypothetical protein